MKAVASPTRLASMLHFSSSWQMRTFPPNETRRAASRLQIFSPTNSPIFRRAESGTAAKQPIPLMPDFLAMSFGFV